MDYQNLINEYAAGPELLRKAVAGMSNAQLDAAPIAGKWTTRQVICHIADTEPLYGERMKRVIAENDPTFFAVDPDTFAARLAYGLRSVEEELQVVDATRRQMTRILRSLTPADFQRIGKHSEDGPMTLLTLLERITRHLPHHVKFIEEKRQHLGG